LRAIRLRKIGFEFPAKTIEGRNPSDASFFPRNQKQNANTMSSTPINRCPSNPGFVVPSRRGVDRPHRHVHTRRIAPLPNPFPARFRFLTEFNAFNGFIFSSKPEIAPTCPGCFPSHPGFFQRKRFQSHIQLLHPTFLASPKPENSACDPPSEIRNSRVRCLCICVGGSDMRLYRGVSVSLSGCVRFWRMLRSGQQIYFI